jgi:hypothetical protein
MALVSMGRARGKSMSLPAFGQHDVGGLEVAMDDAAAMRTVERAGDFDPVARDLASWQRSFLEAGGEGFALEVLHHQVVEVVLAPNVVERADVRVRELGDGAGFALEAGADLGIRGEVGGEDLDGDRAAEAGIARLVDLAHSAFAQLLHDSIRPKRLADHGRVLRWASARPRRSPHAASL